MLRLIRALTPAPPAAGLALEEALFASILRSGNDTLRLWVNDRAVVIGRSQSAAAEVEMDRAKELDIPVLRRISGGGTVYHHPGNLNLSLFLVDGRSLGQVEETFISVGRAIAHIFSELGIHASPCGSSLFIAGKKVGGAAQSRRGNALLYHTTLLVSPDTIPMATLLRAMRPGYIPIGLPSRPHEVTSLTTAMPGLAIDDLIIPLTGAIGKLLAVPVTLGEVTKEERSEACSLSKKYRSDQWNLSR
ncbi:lipoate--protein ligase family protein [Candidatus Bipolaricaulota bacterium]|nr:lipoate--protein ligase family protein [Candidatus Bipolaricaulota bacterium]